MSSWAIVTGEYPPQPGGVSDYVQNVAGNLAATGDAVTVWAPHRKDTAKDDKVVINPFSLTAFSAGERRFANQLESLPEDTRILLQYSPHAFAYKGLNIPLARLFSRLRNHPVDVMFHEVAYPYRRDSGLRYRLLAKAQNYMAKAVAERASRIFVAALAWQPVLKTIVGRPIDVTWLPVPTTLPLDVSRSDAGTLRAELGSGSGLLFGHFGTYGEGIKPYLRHSIPSLLSASNNRHCLLLGRGAAAFRLLLLDSKPALASRVHAREGLDPVILAHHIAACDAMIQPFPDGVTGRRTSLMACIALGIPTATTSGRLTEPLWQSGNGVAMCPPVTERFTTLAEELFRSPERLRELALDGSDLYRRYFAVEHTIKTLRGA